MSYTRKFFASLVLLCVLIGSCFGHPIRSSDAAYTPTPSGTGFAHITASKYDSAARAVNLSGSDVTSTLPISHGGTGQTSFGSGILHSNGSTLSSSACSLTADVSGILPVANGGTGQTSFANGVIHSSSGVLTPTAVDLTSEVSNSLAIANGGTGTTTLANLIASTGAIASRPAAGTAGKLYFANDAPVISYDTGSAWVTFGPFFPLTAPPSQSTFTAINAGGRSTTWSDANGGILGSMTNGANAYDERLMKVGVPGGASAHTLTVHFIPTLQDTNYAGCGIGWRKASSGSFHQFGFIKNNSLLNMLVRRLTADSNGTSPTFSFSADDYSLSNTFVPATSCAGGQWLRLKDDGSSTKYFQHSCDGQNWITVFSVARTTFITPDEVTLWIAQAASSGAATDVRCLFDSYSLTQP